MRYNSIAYPGERPARKSNVVEQPGYRGKAYWSVSYNDQTVMLHCADETAALFLAAKHWGFSFKRPEYHQTAKAIKLGNKPVSLFE